MDLNYTLDQRDLTDIYRTLHSTAAEYTFFSSIHRIFSKVDHVLGHKTSLNKFKTETISSIFSDNDGIKLEINNRRKAQKFTNICILNNTNHSDQLIC